ncbi:MAG: hypothetical protein ACI8ZM_003349 [Crocinitomix sp.]|jgi:hypothetical protein
MLFSQFKLSTKLILIIQAICMLMGTSTHVKWVVDNGFLSENYNANLFTTLFWDSLTFLDPLAALLLFIKPKTGVYLTFFIIVIDVIHNNLFYWNELYVNAPSFSQWLVQYWMILGQILFALFVTITIKGNLKEINYRLKH